MKPDELYAGLTEKQRRRTEMKAEGLNGVEIAKIEGVTHRSVYYSLNSSEKIMKDNVAGHINARLSVPGPKAEFDYSVMANKKRFCKERRLLMKQQGLTTKEIADIDGVSVQAVDQSIKLQENHLNVKYLQKQP